VSTSGNMKDAKEIKGITINVMGREFRVSATAGEERELMAAVDLLNRKMKEVRDSGKVVGNERIAIMAALNIAHEQQQQRVTDRKPSQLSIDDEFVRRKMNEFEHTIEKAISEQEKLF
jgi:cell division protein ZapA